MGLPRCLIGFEPGHEVLAVMALGKEVLVPGEGFHREQDVPFQRNHRLGGSVIGCVPGEHDIPKRGTGAHAVRQFDIGQGQGR